jgi:hypothetical protein
MRYGYIALAKNEFSGLQIHCTAAQNVRRLPLARLPCKRTAYAALQCLLHGLVCCSQR